MSQNLVWESVGEILFLEMDPHTADQSVSKRGEEECEFQKSIVFLLREDGDEHISLYSWET